jgi:hypothetical protein
MRSYRLQRSSILAAAITLMAFAHFARAEEAEMPEAAEVAAAEPASTEPAMTEEEAQIVGVGTADVPIGYVNTKDPWIDRTHDATFNMLWRSARRVDGWFGGASDDSTYMQARGSIAPALLWDEYDGFQPRFRFGVDVPFPGLNERFHAFIGRVNRDEYVTEDEPDSGAFAQQYGPVEDDETLFGIRYRSPKQGDTLEADAGMRLSSPLDPYVKGSYSFIKGSTDRTLFHFRQTLFWQNSEKLGVTSRVDVERAFKDVYMLRWTGSATISQRTEGVRGYTSLQLLRGLPNRRAIAGELFTQGELDADVSLRNYGAKVAYRRSIARDWLVLETRLSLTYPKEYPWEERKANWGVGVGVEMFFGTNEFLARPITF